MTVTDEQVLGELRHEVAAIELDDDVRARMRARIVTGTVDAAPMRPARRRMPRVAFGVAVAGAAAVVLAVALSPLDRGSDSGSPIPAPTPAQAALLEAGRAAGEATWRPLTGDAYFHVYTTSFTPDIPPYENAPTMRRGPGAELESVERVSSSNGVVGASGMVSATERWGKRDGTSVALMAFGGDPDDPRAASTHRDPKTGEVRGVGMRELAPDTDVDRSLAVAQQVMAVTSDGRGAAHQRGWHRDSDAYEVDYDRDETDLRTVAAFSAWYPDTIEQLDALNGAGDVDSATARAVHDDPFGAHIDAYDGFGISAETARREAGMQRAIDLLGTKPLSPRVREALFAWIARQPGGTITKDTDPLGRSGTRVTFETVFDETVPARTITVQDLVDLARARGLDAPDAREVTVRKNTAPGNVSSRSWRVPAHREFRRWRTSILFDQDRGELLESQLYAVQYADTDVYLPRIYVTPDETHVLLQQGRGIAVSQGALLYRTREVVDAIEPELPVCRLHPDACDVTS
jgi:hypothetical protein